MEVRLQNLTDSHEEEKEETRLHRESVNTKLDKLMWMGAVATGIIAAIQFFGIGK